MKNIKFFGLAFLFILLFSLNSFALSESDIVSEYNFANITDIHNNSYVISNLGETKLVYPVYNISGDSSPDSIYIGNTEYILLTNPIDTTEDYSISVRAKFNETGNRDLVYITDGADYIQFRIDGGKIKFKQTGSTTIEVESQLTNYDESSEWNLYTVTYDSFNRIAQVFYNNNVITYSKQTIGSGVSNIALGENVYVGNNANNDRELNGYVDDLIFVQQTLELSDVVTLYEYGELQVIDEPIIDEEVTEFGSCPDTEREWKNTYFLLIIIYVLGIFGAIFSYVFFEFISGIFLILFSVVFFSCWVFFGYFVLISGILFIFSGLFKQF